MRGNEEREVLASSVEIGQEGESVLGTLDRIRNDAGLAESRADRDITATRALIESIEPATEEQSARLAFLKEQIDGLGERLGEIIKLAQVASLAVTLNGTLPGEHTTPMLGAAPITAEMLSTDPTLSQMLSGGIEETAQRYQPVGANPELKSLVVTQLGKEAGQASREIKKHKAIGQTLAIGVAEGVLRRVLDASFFGFGGLAYDVVKGVAVSVHALNQEKKSRPSYTPIVLEGS